MKTILLILGGKVTDGVPSPRFSLRLTTAIEYYKQHTATEEITFIVSGRCVRVTDNEPLTEAEVGKRSILKSLPEACVIKEDISVETIGNFAFSKPLITALKPDKVIIFTSEILEERVRRIAEKIFADDLPYEFRLLRDEMSGNETIVERETKALRLFNKLFADVESGEDPAAREVLLYKTPYYFKGVIDDKEYFDAYWEGGFDHYLAGVAARSNV